MKKRLSKNKPIILIAAILVFVLVVLFIVLSGKTDDTLAGTYTLVDASGTGSEMFKATVGDATLEIDSDNTGSLKMFEQTTAVTVDKKEKKISFDGGKNYSRYTFEKNKLTVDNNGYKAVFKKQ